MGLHFFILLCVCPLSSVICGDTTLYEYFTSGGISEGLTALGQEFKLNGKEIKLLSGSLHYFRLRKLMSN